MIAGENAVWGTHCATSGIGSLPHADLHGALALAFTCDVPYLPELPALGPSEWMVPSALRGLAGLEIDQTGRCVLRPDGEPGEPAFSSSWPAFLVEVKARRPRVAKVQVGGPVTVSSCTSLPDGAPARSIQGARDRITAHLAARVAAQCAALLELGVTPLVVLDEPMLSTEFGELERVLNAARAAGAWVGVHCCGQAPWAEVLGLQLDLLSIDAGLSLESVLEARGPLAGFLKRGGRLGLGLIPTQLGARWTVDALCDAMERSMRAGCPDFRRVLAQSLLTPACGLAGHSVSQAERIAAAVTQAQQRLRASL